MTDDKRQFIRLKTRLMTFYKVLETGKVWRALTQNIGGGGVCFIAEQLLKPGEALELEIKLPDRQQPITFSAEVVWSQPVQGESSTFRMQEAETGVRFVAIHPKDRALIMQYAAMNALPPSSS